jgi:hypothetical protein
MKPWMMWLGVYQSARCWLLSGPLTVSTQSLTVPQAQMGGRPIQSRMIAATATRAKAAYQYLRGMTGAPAKRASDVMTASPGA